MPIAVSQFKAMSILAHCIAEILDRSYTVQRQRRLVCPGDRLVRVDYDHAFSQARDDLLELGSIGALLGYAVRHKPGNLTFVAEYGFEVRLRYARLREPLPTGSSSRMRPA